MSQTQIHLISTSVRNPFSSLLIEMKYMDIKHGISKTLSTAFVADPICVVIKRNFRCI